MPWILGAVAVALVVLLFTRYADHRLGQGELVGNPAPDFAGDFAVNGKPVKLSDLKGKVVLLDFWAVWCKPCISTFPHLLEWNRQYKKDGLEIVGLTMYNQLDLAAEQEMLKEFAGKHKLDYLLMTLPPGQYDKTADAYAVRGIPHVVLIDRRGLVRMVRVGAGEANAKALESEIRKLLEERA